MKALLFCLTWCCMTFLAWGQNMQPVLKVDGTVIDSATKSPLGYVTVALQDAQTQRPVKSTLTKGDGSFELTAPAGRAYRLTLVFVGYQAKMLPIADTASVVHLGNVLLAAATKQLAAVSITAVKPLIKQEVDRLSYDVQADPDSKIISALDMMRKVPLLSVDASDNIKLRGNSSYKILINGKESAMMATNPSDVLKAMQASNIEKIEVITTPPAKYDAEGLAGIINIITKKNAVQGYNGIVKTEYNTVSGYSVNMGASVKEGKLGYSGFAGTRERRYLGADFENLSSYGGASPSSSQQYGANFTGGHTTYNSNALSYELDSLNLLSGTFNYNESNNRLGNDAVTSVYGNTNSLTNAYHTVNNGTSSNHGADAGLDYQLGFKNNKNELLTASYRYHSATGSQFTDIVFDNRSNYSLPDYRQYNANGSKEQTAQLDYIDPLKIWTIEAGAKMILRNNYSDFHNDTLNAVNNQYNTENSQTNNFTYHQDVYSLYNSYQLKFTEWIFKGGLRLEHTVINADFASVGSTLNRQYNNLVPSISLLRNLNATSSLTFGFTQRIQRPGIAQLNPFINLSNPQYITVGNPNLSPAINNNFELNYGNFAKGSLNISTHYSFSDNTIQNITTLGANDVTTTTYANIGANKNLGADLSFNYPITKKWNININAELLQVWLKGTYNGTLYTNSGQQGHIFTFASYRSDNGWRFSVNAGFDSRYVLLEGRDNYFFNQSYGVVKEIFNKKGAVYLTIANPFDKFNKLDFFTKTTDFQTYNSNDNYYRMATLGFFYRFGKLKSAIKKNQRGINNDDTVTGGKN